MDISDKELNELYNKFPAILKKKLLNKEIFFPPTTQFKYEQILVYRAVERKKDDTSAISRNDFRSYYELGKVPKNKTKEELEKKADYYGVSSFLKKEIVELKMKFPNPRKKMAKGYVCAVGGPQETNYESQHVCWWLYEDADVSSFTIDEGDE